MRRAAFGLLFLLCALLAPAQGFDINSFDANLALGKDGVLSVTEKIQVTFTESHHGIFRLIPVVYPTKKGVARGVELTDVDVTTGGGTPIRKKVTREGENLKIRIGDPDEYEPVGTPITYVIRYKVFGQMNWFDEDAGWQPSAELYWNVTGNDWEEAMERVHVTLSFPAVAKSSDVRARVFTGPYGSRQYQEVEGFKSDVVDRVNGTTTSLSKDAMTVETLDALPPGAGLTIVLDVPSALIAKPTFWQTASLVLRNNLGFGIPVVVAVLMGLFWAMYGKDPAKKPVAVQFEPPDGMTGAEVGTLLDERVDQRDIAAGVITLAVNGFLTITPEETGMVFKKRTATMELTGKGDEKDLGPYEKLLLAKLTNCTQPIDESELRTHVAPHLGQLVNSVYDNLIDRGYYTANPQSVRGGWVVGGLLGVGLLAFLCFTINPMGAALPSIVGGILGAGVVVFFGSLMSRRTNAGAEAWRKVKGFEEFIRRARGKEFDWMSKKEPTMSLFEEYLPHAVAFGLATEWAAAFEGILHEMPDWYRAPYGTPFYPAYFGSDMGYISDSIGSAAATPPRSSGGSGGFSGFGGGGGFSGGGFGGGGGGSW